MTEVAKRKRPLRPAPERYRDFIEGRLTVEDLDDEEITRMQLRAKDGSFKGQRPQSVPREFAQAFMLEQQKRHKARMTKMVEDAEKAIARLINPYHIGGPGDAATMKAAQFVIERFGGKTPDNVNVQLTTHKDYEDVIDSVLVDVEEEDE